MLFKEAIMISGAVKNISKFSTNNGFPILPFIFFITFLTGILTGIAVGFIGSTFPLILSLTGSDPHFFTFAFASGFVGVLLSPVHVCLVLTREYFKADIGKMYKKLIPIAILILIVAIAEFLILDYIS